jgi:YHS domain-containing protein
MPRDPVCGMEVDEKDAAAVFQHKGKTYYFCSERCKEQFESQGAAEATLGQASRSASDATAAAPSSGKSLVESSVVRRGGVAKDDAEVEDVTRDTYGFPAAAPTSDSREERIANANRAAEQAGIPGIDLPESPFEVEDRAAREESQRKPGRK